MKALPFSNVVSGNGSPGLFYGIFMILMSCLLGIVNGADNEKGLLKVSYMPEDGSTTLVGELIIRPSPSVDAESLGMNSTALDYTFSKDSDYETHIPKNEHTCVQLIIVGPSKSTLKASWDGKALDLGPEVFNYRNHYSNKKSHSVVAVEFGDSCKLACGEGEAQFEIQHRSDTSDFSENFSLVSGNGTNIVSVSRLEPREKRYFWDYFYTLKICLPKDDCYIFAMGDYFNHYTEQHATIVFNGETLFESKAWRYKSIDFGDKCTASCHPDNQDIVEFILEEELSSETSIHLHWNLTTIGMTDETTVFYEGHITPTSNFLPEQVLRVYRYCVPKKSCLKFNHFAEYADGYEGPPRQGRTNHVLKMDDIIYSLRNSWNSGLSVGTGHGILYPDKPQITYLGTCTTNDMVCGKNGINETALLEVNIRTASGTTFVPWQFPSRIHNLWYVSESSDVDYYIARANGKLKEYTGKKPSPYIVPDDGNEPFLDYEFDTSYRHFTCIPSDECRYSIFVHEDADIVSYSTKLDGILSTSDPYKHVLRLEENGWAYYGLKNYNITPISNGCSVDSFDDPRGLSGGTIAGITVACVVAAGAVATMVMMRMRQKKQQS